MKVYLVMESVRVDQWEDTSVHRVFADRAKAERYCKSYNEDEDMAENFDYYIQVEEVIE